MTQVFYKNSIANLPRGLGNNPFKFYLDRHNTYVKLLAKQLNGLTYRTAPFDISTPDCQFYEVKVTSLYWHCKRKDNYWQIHSRFCLSTDELKFMHLMKQAFHVILVILGEARAKALVINYDNLCRWEPKHLHNGFKKQRLKPFILGKQRMATLTCFPMEN